jgi:hypothetical protein
MYLSVVVADIRGLIPAKIVVDFQECSRVGRPGIECSESEFFWVDFERLKVCSTHLLTKLTTSVSSQDAVNLQSDYSIEQLTRRN